MFLKKKSSPFLLFVIAEDYGLFRHRIDLARQAKEAGYRVGIATRVGRYGEAIQKEGFELYPLKELKRGGLNLSQDLKALKELHTLYQKIKPTIVHHVAMKPVLYGTFAAELARVPCIVNALGGLGYLFISQTLKTKIIRLFLKYLFKLLFLKKKLVLILQNKDDIAILRKTIADSKIHLIRGSGVDTNLFNPKIRETKKSGVVKVLMLSRLLWDKGIGETYEAAHILRKRGLPIEISIAGDIDPENPASLSQEQFNEWKKEGILHLMGATKDILPLLKEADIGLLSSYREGLPKALLEQGAVGLPLIATDVPGCREVVQGGINGFLVPARDGKALAQAIETLALDASLRQRMGKKSRHLVEEHFSVDKINKEILDVYKSLLSS